MKKFILFCAAAMLFSCGNSKKSAELEQSNIDSTMVIQNDSISTDSIVVDTTTLDSVTL